MQAKGSIREKQYRRGKKGEKDYLEWGQRGHCH